MKQYHFRVNISNIFMEEIQHEKDRETFMVSIIIVEQIILS